MDHPGRGEKIALHLTVAIGFVVLLAFSGVAPAAEKENEELFSPYLFSKRAPAGEESWIASLRPADPAEVDAARFAETVRTGVLLVKYGKYQTAAEILEPFRTRQHFTLLHALGVAYVRLNRNQEAYDVLIRAHTLRPNVAGPLLPAALACAKMSKRCYEYRDLALEYKRLGGRFTRMADRIAYHVPYALRRS
jgi:hypothetical protein